MPHVVFFAIAIDTAKGVILLFMLQYLDDSAEQGNEIHFRLVATGSMSACVFSS